MSLEILENTEHSLKGISKNKGLLIGGACVIVVVFVALFRNRGGATATTTDTGYENISTATGGGSTVADTLSQYQDDMNSSLEDYTAYIDDRISSIEDRQTANIDTNIVPGINNPNKNDPGINIPGGSNGTVISNVNDIVDQMRSNSSEWYHSTADVQTDLSAANQSLGASIGAVYQPASGLWYLNGQPLYSVQQPAAQSSSRSSTPRSTGGSVTTSISNDDSIRSQMASNSAAWNNATPAQQAALHDQNVALAAKLSGGSTYNPAAGTWS